MLLSLEVRYTLNYLSENKYTTFSKLSIYGQGQGHRNNKSAQNVSFFLMCSQLFVVASLCPKQLRGGAGVYWFWVVRPYVHPSVRLAF